MEWEPAPPRAAHLLIAALIVAATALYTLGVVVERQLSGDSEAGESAETRAAERNGATEISDGHDGALFGISPESTPGVALVAVVSLALAAGPRVSGLASCWPSSS